MSTQQLNLARKWRSKQFDQIIGQELSVRMLKNSLYLNQLFPVYLFSGQRGCGKTTTARVFAAALSCYQLPDFQKNPKSTVVPCLTCESCLAMATGNHPDFIEIDAASHTGVDNVRTLIEAASLLPVMGKKKIYLIDEAHMLSKAAFNAFLKILEEPPATVIFMLATTDPQKIIETVRSRCFQLFFPAINTQALVKHLQEVCLEEKIKADVKALELIVKETQGLARDALNLLEQVRFSTGTVTQEAVLKALGHLSEEQLLGIFEKIVQGNLHDLLQYLQAINFQAYDAQSIWQKCIEMVRLALFVKSGAIDASSFTQKERFQAIIQKSSLDQLGYFLKILYQQELLLAKTTVQHGLLEMVFLEMCRFLVQPQSVMTVQVQPTVQKSSVVKSAELQPVVNNQATVNVDQDARWEKFIQSIEQLSDPLLNSIFKQATFVSFDEVAKKLVISFAQESTLFTDWLKETEKIWLILLKNVFGEFVEYSAQFMPANSMVNNKIVQKEQGAIQQHAQTTSHKIISPVARQKAATVNISDKEAFKTANQLLDTFGGTIVEVQGDE
jgi:DNA polymerase III subunit gamma/tau